MSNLSYQKNLDLPILAPKLNKSVDSRWLIMQKMVNRWKIIELSEFTGIPKSTVAARTKGFNGSYSLLNTLFRDYILPKPNSARAKIILKWVERNLIDLGDDSGVDIDGDSLSSIFYSKGQERYNSRQETKQDFNIIVDYLTLTRDPDSLCELEEEFEGLNLKFFIYFSEVLCLILKV